jgi:hypothetical protein
MTKEQLEALLKSENVWAARSTLILAIGILGEYVVLPFFEKKEKQSRTKTLFKIVFALLVVAGIGGEYLFSSKISDHALELQTLADTELQAVTTDVGNTHTAANNAAADAVRAKDAAGTAKMSADNAGLSANRAIEVAVSAQTKAEELSTQEETLQGKYFKLGDDLAIMEKSSYPRRLNQFAFAAAIQPYNEFPVTIETISDFEARRTARLIAAALSMGQWKVSAEVVRTDDHSIEDFWFPGVFVDQGCGLGSVPASPESYGEWRKASATQGRCNTAAEHLLHELNQYGIEALGPRVGLVTELNTIRIRVGLKPMPGEVPKGMNIEPKSK